MSLANLKYVIVRRFNREVAIIGSPLIDHCDFLKTGETPVSAGFCRIRSGPPLMVTAGGESLSLQIKSRPGDSRIILETLTGTVV